MPQWSLNRFREPVLLFLFPVFILLGSIEWLSSVGTSKYSDLDRWVSHTQEVKQNIRFASAGIAKAESAQLNYILTGRPNFEALALNVIQNAVGNLGRVKKLTLDNERQRARLLQLEPLFNARVEALLEGMRLRHAGSQDAAIAYVSADSSFIEIERLNEALQGVQAEEDSHLLARIDEARAEAIRAGRLIQFSGGFGSIAFFLAFFFLRRQFRARRIAEITAFQTLAARSTFLANISHEIRTPVHTIMGMAAALSPTSGEAESRQGIAIIQRAANLLIHLIDDILDHAKIEAGKIDIHKATFNLLDLVEQTVAMIAFRANQKGLELSFSVDPEAPLYLLSDANRIRQVILNVLSNAIKFTPKGSISLNVRWLADAENRRAGTLRLVIADTGVGIRPEHHTAVFEKFNQLDISVARTYGGNGLGLTISKQLVELLNGKIWFESEPGVGTTFYVEVPVTEPFVTPKVERRTENIQEHRPLRILIADDVEDNQRLIEIYLKNLPYRLEFARDGHAAFEKWRDDGPFDLIMMDVQMPKLNGYLAVEAIRREETTSKVPRTTIIALTASGLKEDAVRSYEAGCDEHLTKPINREGLLAAILRNAALRPFPEDGVEVTTNQTLFLQQEMRDLVPDFLENRRAELHRLKSAIQKEDFQEIQRIGHALKGVSGTFGFMYLAELAGDLQVAANQFDLAHLNKLSGAIDHHLTEVEINYI